LALSPVGSAEANFWGFTNEGRPMIVKFTGKERDVETGVDILGRGDYRIVGIRNCSQIFRARRLSISLWRGTGALFPDGPA
jgi:hypothetical protein